MSDGKSAAFSSRRLVVLIVDDEPMLRMLAHDIFADGGFDVLEAANADEALSLLAARPDIDLLFTDVNMAGAIDGYALTRLVGAQFPDLLVIAVSSGPDGPAPGDLPKGAAFVAKPYDPAAIIALVSSLIGRPG